MLQLILLYNGDGKNKGNKNVTKKICIMKNCTEAMIQEESKTLESDRCTEEIEEFVFGTVQKGFQKLAGT